MVPLLAKLLVLAGASMLVAALIPTRRLIAQLPKGRVRGRWYVMLAFVSAFLVGYGVYGVAFWHSHERPIDLLVPGIFFLGAVFVWLNAVLSFQTVAALLRLSLLEQENIADPLTGVYNRRYLDRRSHEETSRPRRHGLPQTVRQDAINLAERLRACIGGHAFMLAAVQGQAERTKIRLTCSIGIASLGPQVDSSEMLVHCADRNLYRAKRAGRDRVIADEPDAASS